MDKKDCSNEQSFFDKADDFKWMQKSQYESSKRYLFIVFNYVNILVIFNV